MKSMASICLLLLALSWAGPSSAQAAPDPIAECPSLPADSVPSLRWEVLRLPNMLLCRAVSTESGEEVFALTISPASPFKSRDRDRAEQGMLNGKQVQWYRGEVPNRPELLIRETLIQLRQERVVHIFVRTTDAETLAKYQQLVLSLPFPLYQDD